MLKVVLYQCPKCGLGENGNEFMHKRVYLPEIRLEGKVLDTDQIGFRCRACGYRWEVPCE